MKSENRQQLAKQIYEFAKQALEKGLKDAKKYSIPESLIRSDCKQIRTIARLVRIQGVDSAYRYAQGLDTAVRDMIPDTIWDQLEEG
jgi:hypothetical protein